MEQAIKRRPIRVTVELRCREDAVTLTLRHGDRQQGYRPMGKKWQTLRRGDVVRGPNGYDYLVKRLTLQEAEPTLVEPVEIESIAAWVASGLTR